MKIPWGAFDLETGEWYANELIYHNFPEEKQREWNIKDGYLCECGYMPTRCKCGSKNMPMIYKLSNEELQQAIIHTCDLIFSLKSTQKNLRWDESLVEHAIAHLKTLQEIQVFRARTMEVPKEWRQNSKQSQR